MRRILTAAEAEATRNKWKMVIAVVDGGAHLVHLRRMDGAQLGSIAMVGAVGVSGVTFEQDGQIA